MQNHQQPWFPGLFKRIKPWACATAVLLALASGRLALAVEPGGANRSSTLLRTPTTDWVVVAGGERHLCAMDAKLMPEPQPTPTTAQHNHNSPPPSSAETPLPPVGQTWQIAGGVLHWYAFRDEGDASSIQIRADATPDPCLAFQVWTPEQLRLWQLGETFRPVGQGTPNSTLKADLFWTGSFVKSGTYYVIARHSTLSNDICTYKLWVTGDDVSLVLPTPKR